MASRHSSMHALVLDWNTPGLPTDPNYGPHLASDRPNERHRSTVEIILALTERLLEPQILADQFALTANRKLSQIGQIGAHSCAQA